ncbi:MAG: sporulation transcription factor Spo0A [Caryophanon sp.]|nr:sporulation transcription factor Spo0A [Caryophanon sp.]
MTTIKVAIADDNRELVQQIEMYFQNHAQIEIVATASNGELCLTMLKEHDIDVLMLDLIMPYMDGLAVLEHIRADEQYANLSIVMLTAFGQEEVMKNIVDLGATYLILKPFDFKQLETKIVRWARRNSDELSTIDTVSEEMSLADVYVSNLLTESGIPVHMRGYKYLQKAIAIVYENPSLLNGAVTTAIYPTIASLFGVSDASVERAIRNAINAAWTRDQQTLQMLFQTNTPLELKPKNSEFIALAVTSMRQQLAEQHGETVKS